jgi:hypothetical protein
MADRPVCRLRVRNTERRDQGIAGGHIRLEFFACHAGVAPGIRRALLPRLVVVEFPLLQRLALPITVGTTKFPGIKIHDTRMVRLMEVLLHGGTTVGGSTAKQVHGAILTGKGTKVSLTFVLFHQRLCGRFRIPEHAPEASRIVQIGFELADSAEACQYPEAKAALLQSAEELIKTGRQMLQCTIDEIEQQAYSGA